LVIIIIIIIIITKFEVQGSCCRI